MNNHPAEPLVEASWNVMAHAEKPDFVFRWNGRVHLNHRGVSSVDYWQPRCAHQLLLLVVMLGTPCSEVVWRVLATHSIRQFSLHFPSRASPCAITFHLESTTNVWGSQTKNRIKNGSALVPDKLTKTVNLTGYDTHVTWTCGSVKPCGTLTSEKSDLEDNWHVYSSLVDIRLHNNYSSFTRPSEVQSAAVLVISCHSGDYF